MGSKSVFALGFSRRLPLPTLRRVLHRRLGRAGRTPGVSVPQRRAGRGPAAGRIRCRRDLSVHRRAGSAGRRGRDARSRCTAAAACSTNATAKRCIVHRDLGEPHLPTTCRHFPRVAVQDRRGTFVSLSHFCPTAASMLFQRRAGGDRGGAAGVSGYRLRRPHRHARRPAAAAASAGADGSRRLLRVGAAHGRPMRGRASGGPSRCWRR